MRSTPPALSLSPTHQIAHVYIRRTQDPEFTCEDPYARLKAANAVSRKRLGMRYRFAVVPLDPSAIRGSHGRLPTSDEEDPLVLCSTPRAVSGRLAATEMKPLLLRLAGLS